MQLATNESLAFGATGHGAWGIEYLARRARREVGRDE
jgi:hypothetical protein